MSPGCLPYEAALKHFLVCLPARNFASPANLKVHVTVQSDFKNPPRGHGPHMHPPSGSVRNVEDPTPSHPGLLQMSYGQDTASELGTPIWLFPSSIPTECPGTPPDPRPHCSSETGQQTYLNASLRGDSDINSGDQHRTQAPGGPQGAPRKQTSASHTERSLFLALGV